MGGQALIRSRASGEAAHTGVAAEELEPPAEGVGGHQRMVGAPFLRTGQSEGRCHSANGQPGVDGGLGAAGQEGPPFPPLGRMGR